MPLPDHFAALFALIYGSHLLAYFGLGGALVWWNCRHPDRRIQKDRRGEERAWEEIRRSVLSLIPISALMAGGIWLPAHGYSLFVPLELTWLNAAIMFGVTMLLYDAWFYWAHRLMHWRPLYRFHRVHHGSLAPTVWSNYSDDPLDASVHEGFLLIAPLLLPIPPAVLIAHRLLDHINGQIGHAGFEYFAGPTARSPWPGLCTTFHDQHHELFRFNYGNYFSWWDRWMGTMHPSYDTRVRAMEAGGLPESSRPKATE